MSRTKKDKPKHILYPDTDLSRSAETPKKKKDADTEWHWLRSTPSWWTNLYMNRPLRRKARLWEHKVAQAADEDEIEELDTPNQSKKPHKYYW